MNYVCGILVDIQKDFDTLEHYILLAKQQHYGVQGIVNEWFKSDLSNGKQYVSINGLDSNLASVLYGVPRGSILDPLYFIFNTQQ